MPAESPARGDDIPRRPGKLESGSVIPVVFAGLRSLVMLVVTLAAAVAGLAVARPQANQT
jgi:hypothetical protein